MACSLSRFELGVRMPSTLQILVPEVETLLSLDPEQLGVLLLQVHDGRTSNNGMISPGNYESELFSMSSAAYPRERQQEVLDAIREAFAWLEGQALLIPADSQNRSAWRKIGRRGRRLLSEARLAEYKAASLLPRQLLHPRIKDRVYVNFQSADYSTAVFLAFREVESAVREASTLTGEGTTLMRKAFNKDNGPLTDREADVSEQEARGNLFAGAFGNCRNPHGHRDIKVTPEDAVHMLMLASYLLRIVDTAAADHVARK
jgi:uncharacterized protein (TIGR02391 family)